MTREEIKQRAEDVLISVGLNRGGDAEINTILENHIGMVVRAALEEAAKAVCDECANGEAVIPDRTLGLAHGMTWCDAAPIHLLIAALDKEAKGE